MTEVERVFMDYYRRMRRRSGYEWLRWASEPVPMTLNRSTGFFVGVMLDQQQPAVRAWEAGEHLVRNHFGKAADWWATVATTDLNAVRDVCRIGFRGKSYAVGYPANAFPERLHRNARIMVDTYYGDPREIWSDVDAKEIYKRLRRFHGIGDALAKMATFLLVREYGMAGGKSKRKCLWVKPDEHVRRVSFRLGLAPTNKASDVIRAIEALDLASPADFDAALYLTGQTYCHPGTPDCTECPGAAVCPSRTA